LCFYTASADWRQLAVQFPRSVGIWQVLTPKRPIMTVRSRDARI